MGPVIGLAMGPVIGLAMGLVTGLPFLVLSATGRIALSVIVAVGGAATSTLVLPFHEPNAEISARIEPTVLELTTAGFCALASVCAVQRPGSDTAATAAGISLAFPWCHHSAPVATDLGLLLGQSLAAQRFCSSPT